MLLQRILKERNLVGGPNSPRTPFPCLERCSSPALPQAPRDGGEGAAQGRSSRGAGGGRCSRICASSAEFWRQLFGAKGAPVPDPRWWPLTRRNPGAGSPGAAAHEPPLFAGLTQRPGWTRPCGDRLGFIARGDGLGWSGSALSLGTHRPRLQREGIPPPPLLPLPKV